MIYSMTGFGKASGKYGDKNFVIEIKSLNSKQSDVYVRMPSVYKEKEMELRSFLSKHLQRGKIEFNLNVENHGAESGKSINTAMALNYHSQIKTLQSKIGSEPKDTIATLLNLPDVLQSELQELDEKEWKAVMELADEAVSKLKEFRRDEGAKLKTDFEKRIKNIRSELKVVEEEEAPRIDAVKERIQKAITSSGIDQSKVDENRLEQEFIYYLEKLDITEEKVRLAAHCDYFIETMNGELPGGKKLGFILQEIGREINTIGSKANHAPIQRAVVRMKDESEKIKEQMLNVL